jgi:hypothetical protein
MEKISYADEVASCVVPSLGSLMKESLASFEKITVIDDAAAFGRLKDLSAATAIGSLKDLGPAIAGLKDLGHKSAADVAAFGKLMDLSSASAISSLKDLGPAMAGLNLGLASGFATFIKPSGIFDKIDLLKYSPFIEIDLSDTNDFEDDITCIEKFGFDFISMWLLYPVIKGINKKPLRQQNALLTNILRNYTSTNEFREDLENLLASNNGLKKRKKIILQAYEAHVNKQYTLSILGFLTQVEGVYTDALKKSGDIKLRPNRGKKLVYVDVITEKKEMTGLSRKIEVEASLLKNLSTYSDTVAPIREQLKKSIIDKRNSIMHGSNTSYATASLSVKTLLILLILMIEFDAMKEGHN